MPQVYNITVQIWSIAVTTIHLESRLLQDYQKPETFISVVLNFEEKCVNYMKIMKLTKKIIKEV